MREHLDRVPIYINAPIRHVLVWFRDRTFRRLLQNTGLLASANVIGAILGLLSTVIKTRALGVEQFGLLSVIIAYTLLIQQFSAFGSWQALIKFGAEALKNENKEEIIGQVKLSFLLDGISAISGAVIAFAGSYLFVRWQGWDLATGRMVAFFSLSLLVDFTTGTPIGILRLLDRFGFLGVCNLARGILSVIGALFVYRSDTGIWGFLIVTLIATFAESIMLVVGSLIALRRRSLTGNWQTPYKNWKPFLRFSLWTYATSTVDIPVKRLDMIIVSAVISLEAAGVYKIIKQVISLMDMVVDPLYQAVYPQFAVMIAQHKTRDAAKYALKIGALLFSVFGFISLWLGASSSWWLPMIFGSSFAVAVFPLNVFLFLRVLSITTLTIHPLFNAMGYVKQNTFILLLANMMYLTLAWQLGPRMGLLAIAIAYGFQFSLIVILKAAYTARKGFEQIPDTA